jgi:LSD1 subclass zinc finger protein
VKVRYTLRARSDLESILQYVDQRSPRGARNVKRAIQQTIELIGEFPEGAGLPESKPPEFSRPVAIHI